MADVAAETKGTENSSAAENQQNVTNANPENQNNAKKEESENEVKTPTMEEVLARASAAEADAKKWKNEFDKQSSTLADLKKTVRSLQTAEQQKADEDREADEQHKAYVADLEAFKHKTEAKDRYLMQGMSAEMATKAAEAEVSGDMDALSAIQKQYTTSMMKELENKYKRERRDTNVGADGEVAPTKEQFDRMNYQKRVEFKAKFPELFKEYTK